MAQGPNNISVVNDLLLIETFQRDLTSQGYIYGSYKQSSSTQENNDLGTACSPLPDSCPIPSSLPSRILFSVSNRIAAFSRIALYLPSD